MKTEFVLSTLLVLFLSTLVTESSASCSDKDNTSCSDCVKDFDCYWCVPTKKCGKRPTIKPSKSECDGKWYAFSQCKVSGNFLLIVIPICAFVILVIAIACIYCCCCRNCCRERRRKKWAKEDNRSDQRKKEREDRHAAKDEERRLKHDQIRTKYGLFKENEPKYEKFDAS